MIKTHRENTAPGFAVSINLLLCEISERKRKTVPFRQNKPVLFCYICLLVCFDALRSNQQLFSFLG